MVFLLWYKKNINKVKQKKKNILGRFNFFKDDSATIAKKKLA